MAPGASNRLVHGQPTTFSYGRRDDEFSPVVEFRADCSYQLTNAIALRLGYTATFVDNITTFQGALVGIASSLVAAQWTKVKHPK